MNGRIPKLHARAELSNLGNFNTCGFQDPEFPSQHIYKSTSLKVTRVGHPWVRVNVQSNWQKALSSTCVLCQENYMHPSSHMELNVIRNRTFLFGDSCVTLLKMVLSLK